MSFMIDRAHASMSHVDEVITMQRSQSRRLLEDEIAQIKKSHDEMNDAYTQQEWGYVISAAGSFFQIAAGLFGVQNAAGQYDKLGTTLNAIASLLDKGGNSKIKWDEAKITKLNGLLEVLRNELQNTQGDERELTQKLDQIEKMLLEAIRAMEEQKASAFKKG